MAWARRGWVIVGIVGLLLPVASLAVGDIGDGLLSVYSPDGLFLGTTHGADPAPPDEDDAVPLPLARDPTCVPHVPGVALDAHALVIYARAHDDDDRYDLKAPTIRQLVRNANGRVHESGLATGTAANLKVACTLGEITVLNEVLPTDKANARFNTITNDLRAKAYTDARVKYWVWYDDTGACACGGIANFFRDESLALMNKNNGFSQGPMFAVTFGYDSSRVMLHELSHNLGAVQNGAPHSTLAAHCWDGRDTMCYNDGGPQAFRYTNGICAVEVYDCGNDDYFHTNPAEGSYLATHWNVGSRWNQFIDFADTVAPVALP